VLRPFATSFLLVSLALCAAARTRPHYGGTLRVEIEGDPWQKPSGLARRLILDGLTRIDSNGNLQPALAVEWKSDNQDHRWQFHLRPGVHFSDGSPLTSLTVVSALNLACQSNCPWTAVHAVGTSVVFTGDSPMPNLPFLVAADDYLISLTINGEGKAPDNLTGTGAFEVASLANGILTLAANETCWQGRPFLDTVEIRPHRAIRDQWLDLSVGRADLVQVPPEQLRQAQQQRLTLLTSPPVTLLALEVADTGALADPLLRQAIALAVDRAALSNVIFQKQGEITASLIPATLSGYAFLFPADRDLNKAHELRGGNTPPPLTLAAEGDGAMQLAAQRIALNLREAGFTIQVRDNAQHADLTLRQLHMDRTDPRALLESILRASGEFTESPPAPDASPASLYQAEREALSRNTLIPLLDLPRSVAVSSRVRDLHLGADGQPDIADASLVEASREAAP